MITVVGSLNIDVSTHVARLPVPGETVLGSDVTFGLGGKGANQAVACGRPGAAVNFVAGVGHDTFAASAVNTLERHGVSAEHIVRGERHTSLALIGVDAGGQNSIMVAPSGNAELNARHVPDHLLRGAKVLPVQIADEAAVIHHIAVHHARLPVHQFASIQTAFVSTFLEPEGWFQGRTQTGQTLALAFDLLPEDVRPAALDRLVDLIGARGHHLTTGFLGVRHLLPVLTRFGRSDIAHHLLLQDTFPSWLYSIRQGATTIWERWDGYTHDHGFQTPEMNSFNHYSLGSVGQWLYEGVAGLVLAEDTQAFGHVRIAPHPGPLRWARAEHDSIRGNIRVAWRVEGDAFHLDVTLPPNTRGTVVQPSPYQEDEGTPLTLGSGRTAITARAVTPILSALTKVFR